jgi:TolB protein
MNMADIRFAAAAMATIGLVAGCSSSTNSPAAQQTSIAAHASTAAPAPSTVASAPATPVSATGVEAGLKDVPWSKVGPGWTLAEWSPVTPHRPGEQQAPDAPTPENVPTTVYLVDPSGNRYTITTFAPGSGVRLVDWSGDGSHALFTPGYITPTSAVSVDLHTGEKTTVPVAGYPKYTRPNGTALLVSTSFNGNQPGTLKRIDLQGNPQFTYPTDDLGGAGQFSGDYAESPDGTQLVLGTANLGNQVVARSDNSLVVMSNDGKVIRTLRTPMAKAMCRPVKWWTPGSLLVQCAAERSSATQLWEVPLDGATPTPITALNSGQEDDPGFGGDLGDGDAWKLPSGTFLQSAGACGTAFLSKLTPDGHTTRVKIPGVSDDVVVAGAANDRLLVRGQVGCSGTTSLVSYDPAANTSTVLLGPPVNGGGVSQAVLYPSARS